MRAPISKEDAAARRYHSLHVSRNSATPATFSARRSSHEVRRYAELRDYDAKRDRKMGRHDSNMERVPRAKLISCLAAKRIAAAPAWSCSHIARCRLFTVIAFATEDFKNFGLLDAPVLRA